MDNVTAGNDATILATVVSARQAADLSDRWPSTDLCIVEGQYYAGLAGGRLNSRRHATANHLPRSSERDSGANQRLATTRDSNGRPGADLAWQAGGVPEHGRSTTETSTQVRQSRYAIKDASTKKFSELSAFRRRLMGCKRQMGSRRLGDRNLRSAGFKFGVNWHGQLKICGSRLDPVWLAYKAHHSLIRCKMVILACRELNIWTLLVLSVWNAGNLVWLWWPLSCAGGLSCFRACRHIKDVRDARSK